MQEHFIIFTIPSFDLRLPSAPLRRLSQRKTISLSLLYFFTLDFFILSFHNESFAWNSSFFSLSITWEARENTFAVKYNGVYCSYQRYTFERNGFVCTFKCTRTLIRVSMARLSVEPKGVMVVEGIDAETRLSSKREKGRKISIMWKKFEVSGLDLFRLRLYFTAKGEQRIWN